MTKTDVKALEDQECLICKAKATEYCSFCMDEYEYGPKVPICFYCDEHYESIVQKGYCCSGSERVYGLYQ